jgi:uncharacterized protein YoxC
MSAAAAAIDHTPAWLALVGVIVASAFTFLGVVVTRADKRSQADHDVVINAVHAVSRKVDELAEDMRDVKADVRDLRDADRHQAERIDVLEHPDRIRRIH